MEKIIYDDYSQTFEDATAMKDTLRQLNDNSKWIREVSTQNIKTKAVENAPLFAKEMANEYGCDEDALVDTMAGTQLVLTFDEGASYIPVRDTAMKSLYERTGAGRFVTRCNAEQLALFFNEIGFPTLNKKALILVRGNKVSAVLSDENGGYEDLSMHGLILRTEAALQDRFGDKARFCEGAISHNFMIARYIIDVPELLQEYQALAKASIYSTSFEPQIVIYSSDIGTCSATVVPSFRTSRGTTIGINGTLSVHHKKGVSLDDFEQKLYEVFSKYVDFTKKLGQLSNITIEKPCKAFESMCHKIKLTKKFPMKFYKQALEDFEMYVGDDPVTAHDIYLGMCEIIFYAKCAGYDEAALCRLEDLIASTLAYDWESLNDE